MISSSSSSRSRHQNVHKRNGNHDSETGEAKDENIIYKRLLLQILDGCTASNNFSFVMLPSCTRSGYFAAPGFSTPSISPSSRIFYFSSLLVRPLSYLLPLFLQINKCYKEAEMWPLAILKLLSFNVLKIQTNKCLLKPCKNINVNN